MLNNIPKDLTKLNQWVCFDITEDGKKIPFVPGTNDMAASNRPRDWRSFRSACKDVEDGKRQYVAFTFTTHDPYVFVDLDDPEDEDQKAVFKRLDTYAQLSVSGEGAHLIARGTFKGKGKHPASPAAGLFKENRFCVMTGNVLQNKTTIKAVDECDLQSIHTWLGGGKDYEIEDLVEYTAKIPDQTVVDLGCDRFTKFNDLCSGKWQQFDEYYGDHSTADHAFLAMLCDITESNEQVRFLFSISGMWSSERAEKKSGHGLEGYVNRTVRKIRAKQQRDLRSIEECSLSFGDKKVLTSTPAATPERGKCDLIDSLPEGLVKDIARYSFETSYMPLQEASILVGLQVVSVICGRGYLTPTKSGLNLWLILVGGTSCGKDEYQNGVKRILNKVAKSHPSVLKIFGGEIVSGPGIETVFQDTFRYCSYIPEFGDTFKLLANPQAPDYVKTLSRGLLNSYNAAGVGGTTEGRRKAQGSDEKVRVERPCLCIAGEATPESLYGNMTTRELSTGFLQRFMLLNVPLSSWSMIENENHGAEPPKSLINRLANLAMMMDSADVSNSFQTVEASPEAADLLKRYRNYKRKEIMECPDGLSKKEVINRAGLKALRVASVLAVSSNEYSPTIELEHGNWAINFTEKCDGDILEKFDSGEVGSGQVKQESEIVQACKNVSGMKANLRQSLGMSRKVALEKTMVPLAVIKAKVVNNAVFASDRLGAVTAFDKCIDSMVKAGVFVRVSESLASDSYDHLKGVLLCVGAKYLK